MKLSLERKTEIRRLHFAEHWKVGTIATHFDLHHRTVKRALGLVQRGEQIRDGRMRVQQARKLDPFKERIASILEENPRLRATRLYDMLKARGYQGSVRLVREYVTTVRPKRSRGAFLRIEVLPGEQAQVDWAKVGEIEVTGGTRPLWAFVMVLSYSRAMWAELVFDQTAYSLRRSLVRAAEYFGGVTRQWLFDNPKTVVLDRVGDAVRFHPVLLDVAGAFCVSPRLCTPRSPHQKGKVERAIRFLKERFFAARAISSIQRGNDELLQFLHDIANARPHPHLHEQSVAQAFGEERAKLLPLPSPLPPTDIIEPVSVDKTASIRFDTNSYSVPPEYAEKTLTIVASDTNIRLLDHGREVATHVRDWGRNQRIENREHRQAILKEKVGGRDLKGRDRLRAEIPEVNQLFERWLLDGHNVGSLVSRTLQLLDLYGADILRGAVIEAVNRGTNDLGALSVLCETGRKKAAKPVALPIAFASHVRDRDVIPHDLGGYDD